MTDERIRDLLADALRQVLHACKAMPAEHPGPKEPGNLSSLGPTDWTITYLRDFWNAHDEAQRLIDAIPRQALDDLQTLSGKPWDLVTRRTLDAIAEPIRQTRRSRRDTPAAEKAERKTAERTRWALWDHNPWSGLLQELEARVLDLEAIRGKQYSDTRKRNWWLCWSVSMAERLTCGLSGPGDMYTFDFIEEVTRAEVDAILHVLESKHTSSEDFGDGEIVEFPTYYYQAIPDDEIDNNTSRRLEVADPKAPEFAAELRDHVRRLVAGLRHSTPTPEEPAQATPDATDIPEGTAGGFDELARWTADNLKKTQAAMVEVLIEHGGQLAVADLQTLATIGDFNRTRQRVNDRLRKAGWQIIRHDNEARLEQFRGRQK